jgi:hypothetical protein
MQTVINDVRVISRELVASYEMFAHPLGDEHNGICPRYRPAPYVFAMRIPAEIPSVTSVYNSGYPGQACGDYGIVQNECVMCMEDIDAVRMQLAGECSDQSGRKPVFFSESVNRYASLLEFRSELPRVRGAVDRWLVSFGFLLSRQIHSKAFHAADIEVGQELSDSH